MSAITANNNNNNTPQPIYNTVAGIQIKLEQCFRRKTCPPTSLNRHIVKTDCIYNKLKVTIYLYVSLVKIHPFLNEIGC